MEDRRDAPPLNAPAPIRKGRGSLPTVRCVPECGDTHKLTTDMMRRAVQSYVNGTGATVNENGVTMMCVLDAIGALHE